MNPYCDPEDQPILTPIEAPPSRQKVAELMTRDTTTIENFLVAQVTPVRNVDSRGKTVSHSQRWLRLNEKPALQTTTQRRNIAAPN